MTNTEAVIRGTFPTLDEWQKRIGIPYAPSADSPLAEDDKDWPVYPASQVAWMGLAGAVDNLMAIRRHIEIDELFSFAHLGLCRAALIGSAQATWILGPDSSTDRISHARTVLADMHQKQLQYLSGLVDSLDEPHENTALVHDHVQLRLDELQAKRTAERQKEKLNTTKMITEAAEYAFDDPTLRNEVLLEWQATSGAAHGFVWPILGSPASEVTSPTDESGLAAFTFGGSLDLISNAYCAAFELGKRGWAFLKERG
ncbi:hypothetical protein [Mycobacteroides abscessus]|uniref:hypothetical protein n=1 Tax=Mycobacteroides abscessus TaxID=36809 RepID=UPI00130010AD|nr:hypothetical protein [Mycobacteroides abscessus]